MTERSVVFDQVSRSLFHLSLLVSLFLTFRGHNAPGGGFAGGLVAGGAFTLRYLAGGPSALGAVARVPAATVIGTGLLVALLTGIVPLFVGGTFLESYLTVVDAPLVGDVKLVSSTIFDVGVYILVLGVVVGVLTYLGADDTGVDAPAPDPMAQPLVPPGDRP